MHTNTGVKSDSSIETSTLSLLLPTRYMCKFLSDCSTVYFRHDSKSNTTSDEKAFIHSFRLNGLKVHVRLPRLKVLLNYSVFEHLSVYLLPEVFYGTITFTYCSLGIFFVPFDESYVPACFEKRSLNPVTKMRTAFQIISSLFEESCDHSSGRMKIAINACCNLLDTMLFFFFSISINQFIVNIMFQYRKASLLLIFVAAACGPAAASDCVCLGRSESSGSAEAGSAMPPVEFYTDKGYDAEYGSSCNEWLNPEGKPAICNDGKDCTEPWCYVAADADCDPSVTYDTRFFADTEYAGTLKFSNDACGSNKEAECSSDLDVFVNGVTGCVDGLVFFDDCPFDDGDSGAVACCPPGVTKGSISDGSSFTCVGVGVEDESEASGSEASGAATLLAKATMVGAGIVTTLL